MKKDELIRSVASKCDFTNKDVTAVVNTLFEEITNALIAGEDVKVSDFGKLSVSERKARVCRNPKTGEEIKVPANKSAKFTPSKALKVKLNA